MKIVYTFFFLFILFHFKTIGQTKDSVVVIHSRDFQDDTLAENWTQTIKYRNGKEYFNQTINYYGSLWDDSTLVETFYDDNGKKTYSRKTVISLDECVQEPVVNDNWNIYYFIPDTIVQEIKPVKICNSHFYSITSFNDSMDVTLTDFRSPHYSLKVYDTVKYYPNHQKKSEVTYQDSVYYEGRNYYYQYDEQDRIIENKTEILKHSQVQNSWITKYFYHKDQQLDYYWKFYQANDTLHFKEAIRIYNDQFLQSEYRSLQDGKIVDFMKINYTKEGKQSELTHYNADSSKRDYQTYFWKKSPNREELWRFNDYKHYTEYNGYYYSRTDTIRKKGTTEIQSYSVNDTPKKIRKQKSVMKWRMKLYTIQVFDEFNRLKLIRHLDGNGKIESELTYDYYN